MRRDFVITLNVSKLLNKRRIVAAALLGSTALVCAAVPNNFTAGEVLSAQKLNDNFATLVDLTSDQTIVGKKTFGGDLLVGGHVGIGTTSPAYTLDVSGSVRIDGIQLFQKPGNNGTVSCETFCEGSQWGQVGSCTGGKLASGDYIGCNTAPQTGVVCICGAIP